MGLKEIVGLLGGLALFLYGMQMMSAGMEAAAGNKMKVILEKLTSKTSAHVIQIPIAQINSRAEL